MPAVETESRTDDQVTGLFHEAGSCVDSVRQSLVKPAPSALRLAAPLLERAIRHVETLNQLLRSHPPHRNSDYSGMAAELQLNVAQLAALLESAGAFNPGYTPERMPSNLNAGRQVLGEG